MITNLKAQKPALNLRPGETVQVRAANQILATLDSSGALDGVVFMPEMVEFTGKCFRVFRRVEKTCVEGSPAGVHEFPNNDVVFLEGLRCSGASHDGCGRSCMIFWKEAWLERTARNADFQVTDPSTTIALAARLQAPVIDGSYFCQSTQLINATVPLSRAKRLWICLQDVRVGTYTFPQAVGLFLNPLIGKFLLLFHSRVPFTKRTKTPKGSLDLIPGDLVEVKSAEEIAETLDAIGRNRGLQWSHDLLPYCGRRFRVARRLDKMIVEFNGQMIHPKGTVLLAGANCTCKYVVGGCPRMDLIYWREIWLRKIEEPPQPSLAS